MVDAADRKIAAACERLKGILETYKYHFPEIDRGEIDHKIKYYSHESR